MWAGHLEWAALLHGTIPLFPTYFSGTPVLYPPLGALADSAGGLVGARILSLAFMLAATAALRAAARLSGRRAAFFAAALFAVLGPALHLGSFATYDAMSLFLVALASWLVVRAGHRPDATGWMVAAGAALALANATSYPSALFDPVVLVLALLTALPRPGGKLAAARPLTLLAVLAVIITPALLIGGQRYLHGIDITTLQRAPGTDAPVTVLIHFWSWTGVIVVAAVCGAVIGWISRAGRVQAWRLTVLAAAALLVPAQQAILYTTASLNKHGAMGAWFAAITAGYAVDRLIAAAPEGTGRTVTRAACVIALSFPVTLGAAQSWVFATSWPSSATFVAILRPLADGSNGRLLVEDPSLAEYYLPSGSKWSGGRARGRSPGPPVPDRRPERQGGGCRGWQRRHLRDVHRPGLLLPGGAELHRHEAARPEHRGRPAAQPQVSHHRRRPLRSGPGYLRDLANTSRGRDRAAGRQHRDHGQACHARPGRPAAWPGASPSAGRR